MADLNEIFHGSNVNGMFNISQQNPPQMRHDRQFFRMSCKTSSLPQKFDGLNGNHQNNIHSAHNTMHTQNHLLFANQNLNSCSPSSFNTHAGISNQMCTDSLPPTPFSLPFLDANPGLIDKTVGNMNFANQVHVPNAANLRHQINQTRASSVFNGQSQSCGSSSKFNPEKRTTKAKDNPKTAKEQTIDGLKLIEGTFEDQIFKYSKNAIGSPDQITGATNYVIKFPGIDPMIMNYYDCKLLISRCMHMKLSEVKFAKGSHAAKNKKINSNTPEEISIANGFDKLDNLRQSTPISTECTVQSTDKNPCQIDNQRPSNCFESIQQSSQSHSSSPTVEDCPLPSDYNASGFIESILLAGNSMANGGYQCNTYIDTNSNTATKTAQLSGKLGSDSVPSPFNAIPSLSNSYMTDPTLISCQDDLISVYDSIKVSNDSTNNIELAELFFGQII